MGENHPMDGTGWIVAVCFTAVVIRVLLPSVAPGMQAHVAALGELLGGWRPPAWPRGVQEDDPEAAWANHGRQRTRSRETASVEDLD